MMTTTMMIDDGDDDDSMTMVIIITMIAVLFLLLVNGSAAAEAAAVVGVPAAIRMNLPLGRRSLRGCRCVPDYRDEAVSAGDGELHALDAVASAEFRRAD